MSNTAFFPLCWLIAAAFGAGCGDAPGGKKEIGPPEIGASKAALASSLDAWKAGERVTGVLSGAKPAVGVVDAARSKRRLIGYEILGPLMAVDKGRPFAVRLVLDEPEETVTARYVVLGEDPLWVFRQEDFDRMLHWEHNMGDEEGAEKDPTAPTTTPEPSTARGPAAR